MSITTTQINTEIILLKYIRFDELVEHIQILTRENQKLKEEIKKLKEGFNQDEN